MKKVYHINLKFSGNNFDLYFETQETADRFYNILYQSLTATGKRKLKVTATAHELLDDDTLLKQMIQMLKEI
jgi:hypothetical protein